MRTTIDAGGRLVIPKRIRESAGLKPGGAVQIEFRDGKVQIEPVGKRVKWVRKGSFVVAQAPRGTPPMTHEQVRRIMEETREERVRELWES